jgi:hypothetical protein
VKRLVERFFSFCYTLIVQSSERGSLTVFQDLILVALLGGVLALLTSPEEIGIPFAERRSFKRLNLLYFLGWLPIGVYLLVAHFSWSYWYYISEGEVEPPLRAILTILPLTAEYLTALGSYTLFALLWDRGKKGWVGVVGGVLLLLAIALFILPRERYLYLGSAEEFQWGKAEKLFSTPTSLLEWGAVGVWFSAVFLPILILSLREIRESTRLR